MSDKPDRLQKYDLAGLKLAYSSILGITAQICDITQDDEPEDDAGATIQHLGSAARHLAVLIALRGFDGQTDDDAPVSQEEIASLLEEMVVPREPYAVGGYEVKPSGKVGLREKKEAPDVE